MRVVVQKCLESSVSVDKKLISSIDKGLMVLVGFTHNDTEKEIDYMVNKVINLRVFEDDKGVMNKSVLDEKGEILCISQFTLYGNTEKGNRPSYIDAMKGEEAEELYNIFCNKLNTKIPTKKGVFGADMKVSLINDGPTTIIINSK
ncbi:MAG: D-aminoacyl-tRNA deacylase [Bacilli bacterium]|nr:D-aminoacyl-tRNA deacylase [Bacilli bacterium]